jgi:hypothetical protein
MADFYEMKVSAIVNLKVEIEINRGLVIDITAHYIQTWG